MTASAEGIVVKNDVPEMEVFETDFVDSPFDDINNRSKLGWTELRLTDHFALPIEDRTREVEPLVKERGVGGIAHGNPHLACRGCKVIVNHLQCDLIGCVARHGLAHVRP